MDKYGVDFDSMSYVWTVWVCYVCKLFDREALYYLLKR